MQLVGIQIYNLYTLYASEFLVIQLKTGRFNGLQNWYGTKNKSSERQNNHNHNAITITNFLLCMKVQSVVEIAEPKYCNENYLNYLSYMFTDCMMKFRCISVRCWRADIISPSVARLHKIYIHIQNESVTHYIF